MEITINIDKLKDDMKDYYGTGAFSGMPAMITEVRNIDRMSADELIQKAINDGFDIFKYQV